jgi:hypothetical protein
VVTDRETEAESSGQKMYTLKYRKDLEMTGNPILWLIAAERDMNPNLAGRFNTYNVTNNCYYRPYLDHSVNSIVSFSFSTTKCSKEAQRGKKHEGNGY